MSSGDWVYILILPCFHIILAVSFGAALVHILRGSKLKNVSIMTALLFLANIFGAGGTVLFTIANQVFKAGDIDKASATYVWGGALEAVGDICFYESHWLLAMHYWKTATNTPKVLRKEHFEPTSTQKAVYWIGVALSAVTPAAADYFNAKW
jgi:hypothetical protein